MARKTFISYKYSEAQGSRDKIIKALSNDATYYKGETSDSPDLTDRKTDTIKKNLSDMIFDTTVLIVVISPNVDRSKWIEWEINYATNIQTRDNRTSHRDGVVMVLEDNLVSSDNTYYPNDTTELIDRKANAVKVKLSTFLKDPAVYIEQAYEKRRPV